MPSLFVSYAKHQDDGGGFGNDVFASLPAPTNNGPTTVLGLATMIVTLHNLSQAVTVLNWIVVP